MIVKSFGCSFVFGTDLEDNHNSPTASALTWPALISKHLRLDYACYAKGGAGNLLILDRVLSHAAYNTQDLFIINWTWADRFDFINVNKSNPLHDWDTFTPLSQGLQAATYYKHLHSETKDKLCTLTYIKTAIAMLIEKQIPFIMTFMDEIIFDTQNYCKTTDIHDTMVSVCLAKQSSEYSRVASRLEFAVVVQ